MEEGRVSFILGDLLHFSPRGWMAWFSVRTSITQLSSLAGELGGGGHFGEHSSWSTRQQHGTSRSPGSSIQNLPCSCCPSRGLPGEVCWSRDHRPAFPSLIEPDELSQSQGILTKTFSPRLQSMCCVVSLLILFMYWGGGRGNLVDLFKLRTSSLETVSLWGPDTSWSHP